jgi:NhaP-type Na+/H+ or K+/H+ antiporter
LFTLINSSVYHYVVQSSKTPLVLSLTEAMHRDLFLVIIDIIVVFSIIVQGLTEEPLVKKLEKNSTDLLS